MRFLQLLGALFIKATSYQMIQENSEYESSFFYHVEHASRKSLYNVIKYSDFLSYNETVPYYTGDLPGMGSIARATGLGGNYNNGLNTVAGVMHADELMYLFNVPIPIVMCDPELFLRKLSSVLHKTH